MAYGSSDTYLRLGGNGSGGANSVSYTPAGTNSGGAVGNHTLTVSEIPSHNHLSISTGRSQAFGFTSGGWSAITPDTNNTNATNDKTGSTGGGGAHNHGFTNPTFKGTAATIKTEPKYVGVYAWKRTA